MHAFIKGPPPYQYGCTHRLSQWRRRQERKAEEICSEGSSKSHTAQEDPEDLDHYDIPLDPQLLAQSEIIERTTAEAADETFPDATEEALLDAVIKNRTEKISAVPLLLLPGDFVAYFAKINVVYSQRAAFSQKRPLELTNALEFHEGEAKDEPSLFIIACTNSPVSCTYSTPSPNAVHCHKVFYEVITSTDPQKEPTIATNARLH
jgi:hypothetical protein